MLLLSFEDCIQAQAAAAAASTLSQQNVSLPPAPPGTTQPMPAPVQSTSTIINEDLGPSAAKRARGGEADLLPEEVFLKTCSSSNVTVNVAVPQDYSKPEWNLNGQTLSIKLPYKDYVSVIKEKVFEQLTLPAGKQKLVYEGMFIKDSNTVAFYNMRNNCLISLQLKERGGRKK